MAETFNVPMSFGTQLQMKPRTKTVQFNDGYSLRVGDGLNTMPQRWNIQWNAIPLSTADAMEAFWRIHAGVKWFWWVPPRQTGGIKVICQEWTRTQTDGTKGYDSLTATFLQVFDLA